MRGAAAALVACAIGGLTGFAPVPTAAQQAGGLGNVGVVQSVILTVEPERMFNESAFGKRFVSTLESEAAAIAAENRRIESELTDEERSLTEARDTLAKEEFRARAKAFDEKVQKLRTEQDAKARALGQKREEMRRVFLTAAQPVLEALMRESGAVAILDRRALFLSDASIDVTDLAIARIDAAIGDGSALVPESP